MFIEGREKLAAVYKGFARLFDRFVAEIPDNEIFNLLATEDQSNDLEREYFFSSRLGAGMKELLGEFSIDKIKLQSITINTKRFYDAIQMNRDDLELDRLGLYRPHIQALAESYRRHRHKLVIETLESGWTSNSYDGVSFFNDAHPLPNGQTNDNRLNTGGAGLTENTVATALTLLARMKDDSGNPLGLRGTHLLVPPELEVAARKVVNATLTGGGNTNVLAGRLQVVVSPYLTSASRWYVLDASLSVAKPVVFRVAQPPRLEMDDSRAVLNDIILWVVKARYNAALALYHTIIGAE
jgi:phage major head subunit gpT-like protein